MGRQQNPWMAYWAEREDAGGRFRSQSGLRFCASEVLLFCPREVPYALEIGCGNGDLLPYCHDQFGEYVGIDFSQSMLRELVRRMPEVRCLCANGTALPFVADRFSYVFANGVAQYFDEDALIQNLAEVRRVLRPGGVYAVMNIPDRHLRWVYYSGALRGDRRASLAGFLRTFMATLILRKDDGIGHWHTRNELARAGARIGLACETFSSVSHEYRFHAVFTRVGE
jgi:ubiquinone/menaquinone biosynthesis C-methylase UbiE